MRGTPVRRTDTVPECVAPNSGVAFPVPLELIEAIAGRVAQLLSENLAPAQAEGYLDAEAAAEYLACPKSRIYELTSAGRLRHYRDGRRVLFTRPDLDQLLEIKEIDAK